jgi:electron transport complex protein RnfC
LIAAKILGAKKVILATEDNKPEAIDAMQRAAETLSSPIELEIIVAPTRYPSGGEKQTIELVTGKQVPKGKLPASLGIVVQNVGTLFAVYEAVIEHKPLTRRLVTLTGDKVNQPGNYWLPFGTPIKHLLGLHLFNGDITHFVVGGPLMGTRYTNTDLPVQKNTNCLIFASRASQSHPWVIESKPHQACIRCGECENVCPVNLLPQNLYWYARHDQWQQLDEYNLMDCIECGACAYVCPSEIPLVHYFRYGKSNLRLQARKKAKSDRAKARFEAKEARLAREKAERALKHQKAAEARRKSAQDAAQDPDGKKAAIQAALERVKAKKSNTTDHQSEDLS